MFICRFFIIISYIKAKNEHFKTTLFYIMQNLKNYLKNLHTNTNKVLIPQSFIISRFILKLKQTKLNINC